MKRNNNCDMSIIIPCWLKPLPGKETELLDFTRDTIASILMNGRECEIVIIDNGSEYGIEELKRWSDIYIRNEQNLGYPRAVNQGLRIARTGWIAVANNDIRLNEDCLDEMIGSWLENTGVMSVHVDAIAPPQIVDWRGMCGAFWLTRQEVIKKIGLLDEKFEMGYWEDRDYWKRMEREDYLLMKAGTIRHVGNASSGKLDNLHEYFERNKQYFIEKWGEANI